MVNWGGRWEKREVDDVDDAGVGGPDDSIDDIVGGPLLDGTARGVV